MLKHQFGNIIAVLLALLLTANALEWVDLDKQAELVNQYIWSSRWQITEGSVSDEQMRWLAHQSFLEMRDDSKVVAKARQAATGFRTTCTPGTMTLLQVGNEIFMSSSVKNVATLPMILSFIENSNGNTALLTISRILSRCLVNAPVADTDIPGQATPIQEGHRNKGSCGEIMTALQFAAAHADLSSDDILGSLRGARILTVKFADSNARTTEVVPPCSKDEKVFGCQDIVGILGYTLITTEEQGGRPLNLQKVDPVSVCTLLPPPPSTEDPNPPEENPAKLRAKL